MTPNESTMQNPAARPADPPGGRRLVLAATAAFGLSVLAVPTRAQRAGFAEIRGRWQRPDGGYVLDFRTIDANGKIDAVYLNPQPINIAKAQATVDGSLLKVFVELRAPNYPGSTYTLTYDAQQDQLKGTYFQAVQQQNFDVVFVRMK